MSTEGTGGGAYGNVQSPARLLALAVLKQAIVDGCGGDRDARKDARGWLRTDNGALQFWCDIADVDPSAYVEAAFSQLRNPKHRAGKKRAGEVCTA